MSFTVLPLLLADFMVATPLFSPIDLLLDRKPELSLAPGFRGGLALSLVKDVLFGIALSWKPVADDELAPPLA